MNQINTKKNFNKLKKFFSFRNVFLFAFYILIFFIFLKNSYSYLDPDLGWHLKVGQEMLETGSVPHIEHYDFTLAGNRWVDHEWLINIIVYFIYNNLGYIALNLFFALMAVLVFVLLNSFFIKKFNFNITSFVFLLSIELLAIYGILPHFGVRVQEINVLFLVLLLFIIYKFEEKRNYKILLLMLFLLVLWSFLHGGFLIGFFIAFVFFCTKILELFLKKSKKFDFIKYSYINKKDIIVFAVFCIFSFFLTFLGPYKTELYSFLWQYRDTFYLTHISEWLPIHYLPISEYKIFYLGIIISFITLSLFYKKLKKVNLFNLFLCCIFIVLSIKSKRHFPLLFACSIFLIADYLVFLFQDFGKRIEDFLTLNIINKILIIFSLSIFSLQIFLDISFIQDPFSSFENKYPTDVVDCIRNDEENNKRVFSSYGWGGYIIWKVPEAKLFLDGRLPQYPFNGKESILREYFRFYEEGRSEEFLNKYEIKTQIR